jgi:hypothetical protein
MRVNHTCIQQRQKTLTERGWKTGDDRGSGRITEKLNF